MKYAMTVINAHGHAYVLMPLSDGADNDVIRYKLLEKYIENKEKEKK